MCYVGAACITEGLVNYLEDCGGGRGYALLGEGGLEGRRAGQALTNSVG